MIEKTLRSIWPTGDAAIRNYLTPIIAAFAQSECQDDHYLEELQSGDLAKVAARMWEAMLYARFHGVGWTASNMGKGPDFLRSEEHTSELQSLMRISYAVFCLTKKNTEHSNTKY